MIEFKFDVEGRKRNFDIPLVGGLMGCTRDVTCILLLAVCLAKVDRVLKEIKLDVEGRHGNFDALRHALRVLLVVGSLQCYLCYKCTQGVTCSWLLAV